MNSCLCNRLRSVAYTPRMHFARLPFLIRSLQHALPRSLPTKHQSMLSRPEHPANPRHASIGGSTQCVSHTILMVSIHITSLLHQSAPAAGSPVQTRWPLTHSTLFISPCHTTPLMQSMSKHPTPHSVVHHLRQPCASLSGSTHPTVSNSHYHPVPFHTQLCIICKPWASDNPPAGSPVHRWVAPRPGTASSWRSTLPAHHPP